MKVLLTGGTGFLGRAVVEALLERGAAVTVISRRADRPWGQRVTMARGDTTEPGDWMRSVDGQDVVINLVGAPIVELPRRWTDARKETLRATRVQTTAHLVDALRRAAARPAHLVNQSAVGYYGDRGEQRLDEHATPGDDFLATLCRDWERAAEAAGDMTRVTRLRTAPVIGEGGGVLAPMLLPFKLGLGGPWGAGTQWFPWLDLEDFVRAVLFIIDRKLDGPVNLAGPEPVRVTDFARALGAALHRPALIPAPAVVLKLALGEQAIALLASQRVVPRRLAEAGFQWESRTLQESLERSLSSF